MIWLRYGSGYFNPRSREGNDGARLADAPRRNHISIHAPARGATRGRAPHPPGLLISIHAPARGATSSGSVRENMRKYFNPRSREGSDRCTPPRIFRPCNFNPRSREGSDFMVAGHEGISGHFNPRSREGSDCDLLIALDPLEKFQSTLPRGERRECRISYGSNHVRFQSTLPRGERREVLPDKVAALWISIHAPARGATFPEVVFLHVVEISIHAPARGATSPLSAGRPLLRISIHAPARGATTQRSASSDPSAEFQSTLPRGERPMQFFGKSAKELFQSTLPRGERPSGRSRRSSTPSYFNPRSREGSDRTPSP